MVRKDPSLTEEELISYMRKHVTSYKVPRQVHFREDLPKSNVGKILRRALRARVLAAQRNWTTVPLPDCLVTGEAPTSAAAWGGRWPGPGSGRPRPGSGRG